MKLNKVFAMVGILVVAMVAIMTPATAMAANTENVPTTCPPVIPSDQLGYNQALSTIAMEVSAGTYSCGWTGTGGEIGLVTYDWLTAPDGAVYG